MRVPLHTSVLALVSILTFLPSICCTPVPNDNGPVHVDPVPSKECIIFTSDDNQQMYRNSTLSGNLTALRCIQDDPSPDRGQEPCFPWEWRDCYPLLVANWPGVQISILTSDGGAFNMYRNQENNGLRRTCQKIFATAKELQSQGKPPDVSSVAVFQDDTYVHVQWNREPAIPPDDFPYGLMSEIVYTVWSWVVSTAMHNTLYIRIHDVWNDPKHPRRLGTMFVRRDEIGPWGSTPTAAFKSPTPSASAFASA